MDYNIKRHKMGPIGFIPLYQWKKLCVVLIKYKMEWLYLHRLHYSTMPSEYTFFPRQENEL